MFPRCLKYCLSFYTKLVHTQHIVPFEMYPINNKNAFYYNISFNSLIIIGLKRKDMNKYFTNSF